MTREFWVGDRIVRPSLGEIRLGTERVHLEPRSMQVLVALAERAPEMVPKEELITAVWGDAFVSDEVLTHAVWSLRKAFGDNATDPEFIQTIPKKGYRLIAPVKEMEQVEREASAPNSSLATRALVWGLPTVALLIAFGFWIGRHDPPARRPLAPVPRFALTLVVTEPFPGTEELARRLDSRLLSELAGIQNVDVRQAASCEPVIGSERTYCLETDLLSGTEYYEVSAVLRHASSRKLLYSPPTSEPRSGTELVLEAMLLAELVDTYFEVVRHRHSDDPDIKPWISLQRYDIRAIRDFLQGVTYVYRHEIGAGDKMTTASRRDPSFVAPVVWQAPSIRNGADPAVLTAHRAHLERLRDGATAFEKAMIDWAVALVDDSLPRQIRHLKVALEEAPGNRPALLALGVAFMQQGDFEEAWQTFEPLLEQRWEFPGLYTAAGQCSFHRGRIDNARWALELALESDPVDPDTLALLQILAIYKGDTGAAELYGEWLQRRAREMAPELVEPDVSIFAEQLADRAENEGRRKIASRLRESAS